VAPSLPWTRREAALLAAILLGGVLLRTGLVLALPSPLVSDYLGYWTMAQNLAHGQGLAGADGQPTAFLNVGYPVFLRSAFWLLGTGVGAGKAANVGLGAAAIVLAHVAARRLFRSVAVGLWAALMLALYLEAVVYAAYMAKENLMIVLVLVQLALVSPPMSRHLALRGAGFGVALGGMACVGNAGLAFLPGMLLALWLSLPAQDRLRGCAAFLAPAACLALLTVAPLLWRNHAVFGAYVLNNNGGFNLYIGNNPNATPFFESVAQTPLAPRWQAMRAQLGEHGSDVALRGLAETYIAQHPAATLALALRKAAVFWSPPLHGGQGEQPGGAAAVARLAWSLQYCLLWALFLAACTQFGRLWRPLCVLCVLLAGYMAIHMLFYVIYRYRLPAMPLLCIGAAAGLDMLARRLRTASLIPAPG
jgi:hypothetical protein